MLFAGSGTGEDVDQACRIIEYLGQNTSVSRDLVVVLLGGTPESSLHSIVSRLEWRQRISSISPGKLSTSGLLKRDIDKELAAPVNLSRAMSSQIPFEIALGGRDSLSLACRGQPSLKINLKDNETTLCRYSANGNLERLSGRRDRDFQAMFRP